MAANAGETKVKLWEGICYPENMRDDWQDEIDDILSVAHSNENARPALSQAGGSFV